MLDDTVAAAVDVLSVCSDVDDEDTMQVDWEWGTVRYKMSNYNPPARTPSTSAVVQPPHHGRHHQSSAAMPHRSSSHHHGASSSSHAAGAAAAAGRSEPVNGVTHVSKSSKQISQPVSIVASCGGYMSQSATTYY